jgi:hypothetical protein
MNYQFIVISGCENRKQKMVELFRQLDINNDIIYYLKASTPENSKEYIDGSEKSMEKIICCAKSHFRAIEYAASNNSPEYSIIIEDDAAFHKTYFIKVIEEIIANWNLHFEHCHYVSLGWIPCNTYDSYLTKEKKKIKSISDIDENICFLSDFYNVGLQCYIVKKSKIIDVSLLLNQNTYDNFKNEIKLHFENKYGNKYNNYSCEAVDILLNRLMHFSIIFPPLVIEQDVKSLLGHDNKTHYWNKFFHNHEDNITNYTTY